MGHTNLLNLLRFRIGLYLSGVLLDFVTAKYQLTYCPGTWPTSHIGPLLRILRTSVLNMLASLIEKVGVVAGTLYLGTDPREFVASLDYVNMVSTIPNFLITINQRQKADKT